MADLRAPQARHPTADIPADIFVPYTTYRETDSINLIDYARLVGREWRLMLAIVGFLVLISALLAYSMKPVYQAEVLLAPVSQNKSEGLSTLLNQFGDFSNLIESYATSNKDRTAESIATLRSRSLAMDFIREQNLKPRLFAAQWDEAEQRWREGMKPPSDMEAYQLFDSQVRNVTVDRRSGLVSLTMEWSDPAMAAAWANRLVTMVNDRRRAEAISEAQGSIKYLREQLMRNSAVEVQQAIYRLIEAQTKTIALANAREEYAFRVIDPAVASEHPVRPKRLNIVTSGAVLGLVTGFALVLFRYALRRERARRVSLP